VYKPFELLKLTRRRLGLLYLAGMFPRLAFLGLKLARPLYVNRENALNRTFRYGMLTMGAGLLPPGEFKAYMHGIRAMVDNFAQAMNARKEGRPLVWVEWILSSEIVAAFDALAFNAEALNVFGNVGGEATPSRLVEEAESLGVPPEYCSALKLTVGAYSLGQTPEPDLILSASQPCDTSVSAYQIMEYLTGVPTYTFDAPYWKDEESFAYYEKSVWEMISFMELHLGRPIDWDRLRVILDDVNAFNFYLQEITEMMRAVPSPCTMITPLYAWVVREICIGDPRATRMAKDMYTIVKKRYEQGRGVVPDERLRVVWWNPPFAFFTYIFKWMEHEFGAVVVNDFIGKVDIPKIDTSTEESMVHGLARSHLHLAMGRQCHGPVEFITGELEHAIRTYSADCLIFAGHNGCQHGWAVGKIIKDICRSAKIPALFLNADIMDQRHMNEAGIKREITEFFRSHGLV
jgi:benzoyl-CoA reductase/2-hydroxyglutaryl-CoA dehydratase subunit BcrC/BadD/HgdB